MSSLSSSSPSPWWRLYVFGGVSACCGELASFPLDLAKTRRQLSQVGAGSGVGGLPALARAEGLAGLYRGASAALLRQASYGSLRMGGYEALARLLAADRGASPGAALPYAHKLVAGSLAGFASAFVCAPCDVVKVRMQASSAGAPAYRGHVLLALAAIARADGARGLWTGALPTAARAAVVAAAEIATYDEIKGELVGAGARAASPATHLAAALVAGLVASAAASPIDVLRSNWIVGRARYSSLFDALVQLVRAGGPRALWRGFPSDFARRGPHTLVTYAVLEQLRGAAGG